MCCYMLSGKEGVIFFFFLVFCWAAAALVLAPVSALLSRKADGHRRASGLRGPAPVKSGLQVCV